MARKELDRFDNKAKKALPLTLGLTLLTGIAIVLTEVIVGVVSLTVFNRGYLNETIDDLEYTSGGANRILEDRQMTLKTVSAVYAQNRQLKNALTTNDRSSLKQLVDDAKTAMDLDLFAIVDEKALVVPGATWGLTDGADVSNTKVVRQALAGKSFHTIESIGQMNFCTLYAVPITVDGLVKGVVLCGYDLTKGFTDLISKAFNVQCTVFKDKLRVSTTIPNAVGTELDNQTIVHQVLVTGTPYKGPNVIQGRKYYSVYSPLKGDDKEIVAMLFIDKDLETIEQIQTKTIKWVVPIVLIVAVLMLLFCFLFFKRLMWRIANVTHF
ncbi:MAG: cache domain-containing protein, partial [Treponema sp.]|nr:cache domain-containing protein [Treponema sp.]